MTKSIYSLKSTSFGGVYSITKFDHSLEMESTYQVSDDRCDCPQGHKPTCRHRKMLPVFLELARQDTEYFLDFDTRTWHRPLTLDYEVEYHNIELAKLTRKTPKPTSAPPTQTPDAGLAAEGAQASLARANVSSVALEPSAAPLKRRRV